MTINGTSGNDTLAGTTGDDTFDLSQGGDDTAFGDVGNDLFLMGSTFDAHDKIDGGDGIDTIELDGPYAVSLNATTITSIDKIVLDAGHSYTLKTVDANIDAAALATEEFVLDASALGAGNSVSFNVNAETDSFVIFMGGAGDDTVKGSQGGNEFDLQTGGNDWARGGKGVDIFVMGGGFNAADHLDGGPNTSALFDTAYLDGDYAGGVVFTNTTMQNIATIDLAAGHDYNLKISDATFTSAMDFATIDGSFLGASDHLVFDGSNETDTFLSIHGGAGDDTLTGGAQLDELYMGLGADRVKGRAGDDYIFAGGDGALSTTDRIDGGTGSNTLRVNGVQSITFTHMILKNIQHIDGFGGNYQITMADNVLGAGGTISVDMSAASASSALNFNAAAETDGRYIVSGTQGDDTIVGGAGRDLLAGMAGKDVLTGNLGNDTFIFYHASDSTSSSYDHIQDFHSHGDKIALDVTVTGINAVVTAGALSDASIDGDLSAAIGAGQLSASHAVLFTPDTGDLAGHVMLVVDANGQAGYQAGADYVIEVTGGTRLAEMTTIDFTHS